MHDKAACSWLATCDIGVAWIRNEQERLAMHVISGGGVFIFNYYYGGGFFFKIKVVIS